MPSPCRSVAGTATAGCCSATPPTAIGPADRREELIGRTLAELYGDDRLGRRRRAPLPPPSRAAPCTTSAASRTRAPARAGRARWSSPTAMPQGEVEAIYTIAFDIHDDVSSARRCMTARKRLDRFTEHIPYPLTYVDRDCVLRFVNRAYSQAVGMPAPRTARAATSARCAARRAGRSTSPTSSVRWRRSRCSTRAWSTACRSGPRWLRTSYVPDFDDDGQVQGVYTVTIDVHDLTEAQQRLQRSVERDALTDALSRRTMMERSMPPRRPVRDAAGGAVLRRPRRLQGAQRRAGPCSRRRACWWRWRRRCRGACAPTTPSAASAATSSWCWPACAMRPAPHALAEPPAGGGADCAARCAGLRRVSASIGYALAPHDATQPLRLLQLADDAMYAAKRARQEPRDALRRGLAAPRPVAGRQPSRSASVRRVDAGARAGTARGGADGSQQQRVDQGTRAGVVGGSTSSTRRWPPSSSSRADPVAVAEQRLDDGLDLQRIGGDRSGQRVERQAALRARAWRAPARRSRPAPASKRCPGRGRQARDAHRQARRIGRDHRAPQHDDPADVDPQQQDRHRGEGAVDRRVGGHRADVPGQRRLASSTPTATNTPPASAWRQRTCVFGT